MKKLALTIAIVLGLSLNTFAEYGGGLFQRSSISGEGYYSTYYTYDYQTGQWSNAPMLPNHGMDDNQDAPLGTGIAVLAGLGAAYLVSKKRKEE